MGFFVTYVYPLFVLVLGILLGFFIDALKIQYPRNRFDHYIRKHLRKRSIKGEDFVYESSVEFDGIPSDDLESLFKLKEQNPYLDILEKIKLNEIAISDCSRVGNDIRCHVSFGDKYGSVILNFNSNGDTGIEELNDVVSGKPKSYLSITVNLTEWKFKILKRLLTDSRALMDEILSTMKNSKMPYTSRRDSLTFKTGKTPLLLSYLSRASKQTGNISLPLTGDSKVYFFSGRCKFTNLKGTTADQNDIVEAVIWYV